MKFCVLHGSVDDLNIFNLFWDVVSLINMCQYQVWTPTCLVNSTLETSQTRLQHCSRNNLESLDP